MKFYSPENQSVICLKLLTPENMENIAYIYRVIPEMVVITRNSPDFNSQDCWIRQICS